MYFVGLFSYICLICVDIFFPSVLCIIQNVSNIIQVFIFSTCYSVISLFFHCELLPLDLSIVNGVLVSFSISHTKGIIQDVPKCSILKVGICETSQFIIYTDISDNQPKFNICCCFFFTILYFILVFERICKYILKCFLRDFYFQNILLDLIFFNLGYRSVNHRRLIYRCLSTIASTCSLLS